MRNIYKTNNGLHEILEGQDFLIQDDWVKVQLKEDGTPYSYYNTDGTPDLLSIENAEIAELERMFREDRDSLLVKCDIELNIAIDNGDTIREAELRIYRQALRDATNNWVMPENTLGV